MDHGETCQRVNFSFLFTLETSELAGLFVSNKRAGKLRCVAV